MSSSDLVGTWSGTNAFRLMPSDPLREFPATASVTTAAGGHLTLLAYTWEHPDDGPQDGVILIGPSAESGPADEDSPAAEGSPAGEGAAVTATWGDSWHQQPAPMVLSGRRSADGSISVECGYGGGWAWRIRLESTEATDLRLRMENVVPADHAGPGKAAGPYPVMILRARRS